VARFDIGWIGGISEGRKVAALAENFDRPIAPHDCTGLPRIDDGFAWPMSGPGLGTALQPDLRARPDATVRRSAL
jgi:galactonate dehydratase